MSVGEARGSARTCWFDKSSRMLLLHGECRPPGEGQEPRVTSRNFAIEAKCRMIGGYLLVYFLFLYQNKTMPNKYEKNIDLQPIQISKADLEQIIGKLEALIKGANAAIPQKDQDYSISIGQDAETVSNDSWTDKDAFLHTPEVSTVFSARYYTSSKAAPIKQVSINLKHGWRQIHVEGHDSSQVFAFASSVKESFKEHHVIMGGPVFSGILFVFCLGAGYALLNLKMEGKWGIVSVICGFIFYITAIYFLFSDTKPFPGFAMYQQSASFIDRYGAVVGFWTSVIGITITAVQYLISFIAKKQP